MKIESSTKDVEMGQKNEGKNLISKLQALALLREVRAKPQGQGSQ